MSNYFNQLSLRDQLHQLGQCRFMEASEFENGIKTEIHYPIPPHKQKAMEKFLNNEYPVTEEIHDTTLSLPISYCHSKEDIFKVCKMINSW